MKEHPILFNTEMVQAILGDRKTNTRRICKHQHWSFSELTDVNTNCIFQKKDRNVSCPFGNIGDLLYVRETFIEWPEGEYQYKASTVVFNKEFKSSSSKIYWEKYKEDTIAAIDLVKWKPSLHMPKKAARIWLQITDIKIEQLKNISEADAKNEGLLYSPPANVFGGLVPNNNISSNLFHWFDSPKTAFKDYWNFICRNSEEPVFWEDNPYVWVIKFKVLTTTGKPYTTLIIN